ncbi:hypothetical protein DVK02_08155 [Halobellus sp. Atlit-31R]|nr:hypothetical protein DVK02_08155 [Halobellus sp. Atlit-31R]
MVSNGLPLIPDLSAFPRPVRYVAVALLAGVPIAVVLVVLIGFANSPTAALDAIVVDAPTSDAEVYPLSSFDGESPVRQVVEAALQARSASVQTTTERLQSADVPIDKFYVRHDGRVVRVAVRR